MERTAEQLRAMAASCRETAQRADRTKDYNEGMAEAQAYEARAQLLDGKGATRQPLPRATAPAAVSREDRIEIAMTQMEKMLGMRK